MAFMTGSRLHGFDERPPWPEFDWAKPRHEAQLQIQLASHQPDARLNQLPILRLMGKRK
jgi:hypothetical protein